MRFLLLATAFTFSISSVVVAQAAVKKVKRYYMTETVTLPDGTTKKVRIPLKKINGKYYRIKRQPEPKALPAANPTSSAQLPTTTSQPAKKKAKKKTITTAKLPAANTISAPQTVATKPEKKSTWGVSFLNQFNIDQTEIDSGEGDVGGYNRLTISNSFGTPYSFQIRPQFFTNYDLEAGSMKHTLGDIRLEMKKGEVFNLGALKSGGGLRFDLPTGEASRGASQNGMAQVQLTPSATFSSNISYGGWWAARYHLQSERAAFKGFDGDGALVATSGNREFRVLTENWVTFKINDTFEIGPLLGTDYGTFYSEPNLNVDSNATLHVYGELDLGITATDSLSFTISVVQTHKFIDDNNDTEDFELLNDEELTYLLTTSISFL